MKIQDIISAITEFAPLNLQEAWDNSGIQVGDATAQCTGVMLCVDPTPAVITEAKSKNCNLVIAHHPLLFKGLKQICADNGPVQQAVIEAIRGDITIFSAHTCLDSTPGGISYEMAQKLGAKPLETLTKGNEPDAGLGLIAEFDTPKSIEEFISLIKNKFSSPVVRSSNCVKTIKRIGLCGGAGGEFIPTAISRNCDAYLSSDIRYHDFVDYGNRIFIADIGHFESENCAKDIFYRLISEKFHNFAVYKSELESNPIKYL